MAHHDPHADADRAAAGGARDAVSELAELLSHASRRLRRGAATQLAPLGVTPAQARVLRTVASAPGTLRMADIAAQLDVVPRTATSMVDALEHAGLVGRATDPGDRRSVRVAPTAEGRALLRRLDAARRRGAAELFGGLDPGDQAELLRLLHLLCHQGRCGACAADAVAGTDRKDPR